MARLFIDTLNGVAFDWFRSLPSRSINSWIDLETWFLSRFYEDDPEVTINKLLSTVQKGGESVWEYTERFHNLSLICPAGMPLHMLLQTCKYNFLDRVAVRMGAVKDHTWKKLIEQAEIAVKSVKTFEPLVPKNKWGVTPRDVMQPNLPNQKGKKWWQSSCLGDWDFTCT